MQLTTEAAVHWSQKRQLSTPHLYRSVLECVQTLLSVPVAVTALNEERLVPLPAMPAQQDRLGTASKAYPQVQTAAQALLEALAYQRCGCALALMCGEEDTAELLDDVIKQLLFACPLHSTLKLLALTARGALHLFSTELRSGGEDGSEQDSHALRKSMYALSASCLGYLTAQMTLIHASLPPAAVAPALNERLGVLRVGADLRKEMDESVLGELRAAVQSFVREYALAGGYPQYLLTKEVLGVTSAGSNARAQPLVIEMRHVISKEPKVDELLGRLEQLLRRCIYQDTEPAAMLALHDFQVQHLGWLEQHLEALPASLYKSMVESVLKKAAGARRVEPLMPERPLSPGGNYANIPSAASSRDSSRAPTPSSDPKTSRLPRAPTSYHCGAGNPTGASSPVATQRTTRTSPPSRAAATPIRVSPPGHSRWRG
ncbi:hypothetical protein N2152v2_004026 [Parachlorella kessleri]